MRWHELTSWACPTKLNLIMVAIAGPRYPEQIQITETKDPAERCCKLLSDSALNCGAVLIAQSKDLGSMRN